MGLQKKVAQILRFFGWMAWGVVTTIIFVGLIATVLFESGSSLGDAFAEPETIGILLIAYVPGGVLYLLGSLVDWINAREAAAKPTANKETSQ